MAVRNRRVFGPLALTVAGAAVYTVPTGRVLILRTWWMTNPTGAAASYKVGIGGLANSQLLQPNGQQAATSVTPLSAGIILNPGDQLWASASAANTIYMTVFGSLLLGAPT